MKGKGMVNTFLYSPPSRTENVRQSVVDFCFNDDEDDDEDDDDDDLEDCAEGGGLLKVLLKPTRNYGKKATERKMGARKSGRLKRTRSTTNFEDVVDEVGAQTNTTAMDILTSVGAIGRMRWILSEKSGFTPDMEDEFCLSFHRDHTCKKIAQRLDLQFLAVFVLSVLEFMWNIPSPHHPDLGWAQNHDLFGTWPRKSIFIGSRLLALCIIVVTRYVSTQEWVRSAPRFQNWIVLSSCGITLALFLSYDVMITGVIATPNDERPGGVIAPFDQIFSLFFVLLFFFICSAHKVLFLHSLIYIPLALVLIACTSIRSQSGIYFPLIGQVLFFRHCNFVFNARALRGAES
jgi:hypothetical protein